jgi:hypothetical protein
MIFRVTITRVIDTHLHADHYSGGRVLAGTPWIYRARQRLRVPATCIGMSAKLTATTSTHSATNAKKSSMGGVGCIAK